MSVGCTIQIALLIALVGLAWLLVSVKDGAMPFVWKDHELIGHPRKVPGLLQETRMRALHVDPTEWALALFSWWVLLGVGFWICSSLQTSGSVSP